MSDIDHIKQTLNTQEGKVIMDMRKYPYQTLKIIMENGKVVHKERIEPIKD